MNRSSTAPASERAWRRVSGDLVVTETVGDGLACYLRSSGETHILDAFPAEVFKTLPDDGTALAEDAVVARFAAMLGEEPVSWRQAVVAVLQSMTKVSIVEIVLR